MTFIPIRLGSGKRNCWANFIKANLSHANLSQAVLEGAALTGANLRKARLNAAHLDGANLSGASLVETNLTHATLTGCRIYGISAWNVELEGAEQSNLVITRVYEPAVTVSNLKVAQFLYLLIHNPEIRDVLDTITSKVVLILGRFTDERAIPQELSAIVRNLQSVPVLPLLHESGEPWGMFSAIKRRATVLPILKYNSESELIGKIQTDVINVVEEKVIELAP